MLLFELYKLNQCAFDTDTNLQNYIKCILITFAEMEQTLLQKYCAIIAKEFQCRIYLIQ